MAPKWILWKSPMNKLRFGAALAAAAFISTAQAEVTYTPLGKRLALRFNIDFDYANEDVLFYTQIFNRSHNDSGKQPTALAMSVLAYAENIDDPSVLAPVITLIANKHASLGIRAEHYPIVGKHLLASIGEVLGDAASDELIAAWAAAYQQLADILIGLGTELYRNAATAEGGWSGWRPFKVGRRVEESAEIASFYLYPVDTAPVPQFKPGQFVSVRGLAGTDGYVQPRQYSLSDAPNGRYLRLSVKRERDGRDSGPMQPMGPQGPTLAERRMGMTETSGRPGAPNSSADNTLQSYLSNMERLTPQQQQAAEQAGRNQAQAAQRMFPMLRSHSDWPPMSCTYRRRKPALSQSLKSWVASTRPVDSLRSV